MIEDSNINDNEFYQTFQREPLPLPKLKTVFQQYYYYILTFPQILAGTAHIVDNEYIRMQLARTAVSELGDGWVSFAYFYLHMLVESDHVDWVQAAVLEVCQNPEAAEQVQDGAAKVLKLLANFWGGLDRLANS